jgi:hypothetical protein
MGLSLKGSITATLPLKLAVIFGGDFSLTPKGVREYLFGMGDSTLFVPGFNSGNRSNLDDPPPGL